MAATSPVAPPPAVAAATATPAPGAAAASVAFSPSSPDQLPLYRCPRVDPINPDDPPMNPDLSPWADAPTADAFYLCDAKTAATRRTAASAVWDDNGISFLFVCNDPNIWSHFTEDQEPLFKEEVVEVFLDPAGEGRDYFEFEVSPQNKRFAAEIRNDGGIPPKFSPNRPLDASRVATRVSIEGSVNSPNDADRRWIVFVHIPFDLLDHPAPKVGDVWRGNLYRIDRQAPGGAPDEFSCWSPTHSEKPNFHISRYFGKIEFAGGKK